MPAWGALPAAAERPLLTKLREYAAQKAWGILSGARDAIMLPGDVYQGKVDPRSDEAIGRAFDLAGMVTLGAGAVPAKAGDLRMGIKAYHATDQPFESFDFKRLGRNTKLNIVEGGSSGKWAMNLAKLGAWASEKDIAKSMALTHTLPVQIEGKGKAFKSLDALEAAISKAGGPKKYRDKLLSDGYGHVKVRDEEVGGTSYVALSPKNFRVTPDA